MIDEELTAADLDGYDPEGVLEAAEDLLSEEPEDRSAMFWRQTKETRIRLAKAAGFVGADDDPDCHTMTLEDYLAKSDHEHYRRNRSDWEAVARTEEKRNMPEAALLTMTEVAQLLRIKDRRTIRGAVNRGEIPAPIQIGGSLRWSAREIQSVLDGEYRGRREPVAQ